MNDIKTAVAKQACVLLVEDDVTISDLLAYNLTRAGYRVVQEYTGRAGVEAALSQRVHRKKSRTTAIAWEGCGR